MAKNYEQIYEAVYTKGNKMDFGNSIIRGNGVPLDITSVYDSFDSAVVYAATNPVAYEGQVVAVTESNETIVYVISPVSQEKKMIDEVEYDVYLARVGSVTLGDGDTIILNEETGVLSLKGFADAETNTKLIKNADGNISWVTDEATEIQGNISALEERVGKTESDIATNASNITTNANAIDALEAKFESMGGIFNFAGTCTSDELANLDKTKYQPGDVILVDGSKEYLAVEDGETIKWEPFGDAQGVSALAGKVTTLEGQINGTGKGEDHVKGLTEKLADEVAARGVTDGKVATLESDNITNKTDIANLKVADATLQSNIDAKVAQVDYDKKVEEIAGKFETIESNFAEELGKKVDNTKFEKEVGKLESAIDGKADKATYEAKVAELAEDIAENAKAISDHAGEYTTLSGKVTANEQAIVLKADKSVVDGHTTTIGEHSTAIAKNTGDIAAEKGRVDSLIETVTNNKKATDKTQEDLTALTTTVNNNKTAADKTQEDLDVLEGKVEALEVTGGQANVIEKVKVNGVDLPITDKAVNVTVPTGALASKNKISENELETTLATKINNKEDSTAVDSKIKTAIEALDVTDAPVDGQYVNGVSQVDGKIVVTRADIPEYDDTALAGRVTNVEDDVAIIKGDYLKASDKTELEGKIDAKVSIIDYNAKVKSFEDADSTMADRLDILEAIDHDAYKGYADQAELDAIASAKGYTDSVIANIPAQVNYTVTVTESSPEGYAKAYTIAQEATGLSTTINIPKDMVVESGSVVVNPEGQSKGTYLKLVLANATEDEIFINVGDLIEYVTAKNATDADVFVAINENHEVSATLSEDVKTSLNNANSAVQPSDIIDVVRTNDITDVVRTDDITDVVRTSNIADMATKTWVGEQEFATQSALADVSAVAENATTVAEVDAQIKAFGYETVENVGKVIERVIELEKVDHTHDNKALLDTYTQTEANLADAVAKKHSHAEGVKDIVTIDGELSFIDNTLSYSHPTQNATTASFVKVGNDEKGHVVVGDAIVKGDLTTLLDAGDGTYDAKGDADKALADAKKYTDDELTELLSWGTF